MSSRIFSAALAVTISQLLVLALIISGAPQLQAQGQGQQNPYNPQLQPTDQCGGQSDPAFQDCMEYKVYLSRGGNDPTCEEIFQKLMELDRQIAPLVDTINRLSRTSPQSPQLYNLKLKLGNLQNVQYYSANSERRQRCYTPGDNPQYPAFVPVRPPIPPNREPGPTPQPLPQPQPPEPEAPNQPNPTLGCPASSVSSPAGQAEMCGKGPDIKTAAGGPALGASLQEYAKAAVPLNQEEISVLNRRGIYVFPQGETPWCAIAASSTVIQANTARSPSIPALAAQLNKYLTGIGQNDPRALHGYTI